MPKNFNSPLLPGKIGAERSAPSASADSKVASQSVPSGIRRHLLLLPFLISFLIISACASVATQKKASFHYQMGLSYLGESNYTEALVELSEAEKLTPDDPNLLNKLALAYYYKKKYELAEQRYLRALKIKTDFSEVRNNLGVTYLEMKRWDDAIQQFRAVSDDIFFRDQEGAGINLGIAYLGKEDYTNALAALRAVVVNNPRNALGRLHLGRVYFAMNKPTLAVDEFKKALDINKDFPMANYQLALAYLQVKETALASSCFKEVTRLAPDSEIGLLSKEHLNNLK